MNAIHKLPLSLELLAAAWIWAMTIPMSAEEYRDFTSQAGKTLRATIVSATESDVTLKREDGGQITGGVAFFSPSDQEFIANWRKANPSKQAYDFTIETSRQRVDRTKASEGNLNVVYETWKFLIKIENRTKSGNSGVSLEGLKVAYNIHKTAKARAREARSQNEALTPAGSLLVKADVIDLGKIDYLKTMQVETDTVPVNASELAPGWYYADGSKDEHNDELEGITVKILKDDQVIAEKSFGSKASAEAKWVGPGGTAAPKP